MEKPDQEEQKKMDRAQMANGDEKVTTEEDNLPIEPQIMWITEAAPPSPTIPKEAEEPLVEPVVTSEPGQKAALNTEPTPDPQPVTEADVPLKVETKPVGEDQSNGITNKFVGLSTTKESKPVREEEMAEDKIKEAIPTVDEEKKATKVIVGEGTTENGMTTVKDENGFVYYKCRFCGLTFNFITTLKAHERVHDINQPFVCNKCGESFHFMCELEYHAKQHLKTKGYKCDCGRTFYQYTELLYHKHPGEDPDPIILPMPSAPAPPLIPTSSALVDPSHFPVPEFAEKGFEPKHPLRVYSDVRSKPYICQYCSKSYSDSRGLAYHMYSHRGERLFNPRASRYLMSREENTYIPAGAPRVVLETVFPLDDTVPI